MNNKVALHNCKRCGPLYNEDQVYIYRRKETANEELFKVFCKACNSRAAGKHKRKTVEQLHDTYIKRTLKMPKGIEVPQELIDLKREQIKLKRLRKQKMQEELEQWAKEFYLQSTRGNDEGHI